MIDDPLVKQLLTSIVEDESNLPIVQALNDGIETDEVIDIKKEGKSLMIGFNPKFVIDALKVIDDEYIDIYMFNSKAPCFIKDEKESYIYLVLPVNFNSVG